PGRLRDGQGGLRAAPGGRRAGAGSPARPRGRGPRPRTERRDNTRATSIPGDHTTSRPGPRRGLATATLTLVWGINWYRSIFRKGPARLAAYGARLATKLYA